MSQDQPVQNGRPPETQPNARQRILVVDDDHEVRRLTAAVLGRSGYEVDTATDGAAAWDALQLQKYDLLITDNQMPKLSGMELLKKIHAACISLPAIMVSGSLLGKSPAPHPELHIEAALPKPCKLEEFLTTVKNVLRNQADACREITPPPNWQSQSHSNIRPQ